ncbi:hypothetical protein NFHSH190041_12640 [Shewanella sp. NFH-SH190041]|nr:hypothetical protein NFHSH190041_12640 [Shewanella sp. NFH-SH190041]
MGGSTGAIATVRAKDSNNLTRIGVVVAPNTAITISKAATLHKGQR